MIKILLTVVLISSALFSYEISLEKPKHIQKPTVAKEHKELHRDDSKDLVIDKSNGLMWQDDLEAKTIRKNRKDAKQYCRYLVFAGFKDWYLPTEKELRLIVDKSRYNPAIRKEFKNVQADHYWTSSPNLSDIITAINIDFKGGDSYKNTRKGKCYVRCVRGKYKL